MQKPLPIHTTVIDTVNTQDTQMRDMHNPSLPPLEVLLAAQGAISSVPQMGKMVINNVGIKETLNSNCKET